MPGVRYLRTMINGVPVVTAPAEIDIITAGQLRAVLTEETGAGQPTVVVDMTGTVFCDAAGLHALLWAHKLARAEGGELRLIVPAGGTVARVISLTCLDYLIPCYSSLAGALTLAARRGPAQLAARAAAAPEPKDRS